MQKIDLQQTAAFLYSCEDAYILIHQSPDGDCVGSGYSLQAVLRQMGKRAKVLCADPIPARYDFLMPEEPEEDFEPQCIISVDVADPKLLGRYREMYGDRVDLCIDHHVSNLLYAKQTLLNADAAAACEILYQLYRFMEMADSEYNVNFTEQIARCLYTGMATDTGCFKFDNTTPETHLYTAQLMRQFPEIRYGRINRNMFDVKAPSRLKAEMLMIQAMEYYLDGKCAMICVTQELREKTGMSEDDTEGLTGLPTQPEGVEVGITLREREPGVYKVSLRSANDVNVSAICQTLGGGGHVKAAGCLLKGDLDAVKQTLVEAVRKGMEQA
ncbi:MAG: bifunctional oligoribonuclease/PAP phosphatase NrnA [Oscillospiraceae bacterium]|nr:bifunctional oligoribonuclease/PAP phosphatase NrnA [Oscillospiraceae bacterium]